MITNILRLWVLASLAGLLIASSAGMGCANSGMSISPEKSGSDSLLKSDLNGLPAGAADRAARPHYMPDEVLVVLNDGAELSMGVSAFDEYPLSTIRTYNFRWATVHHLNITDDTSVEDMVERLSTDPNVRLCSANYLRYFQDAPYVPNDPLWESNDPGDDPRDSVYDQWGPAKLGASLVWNESTGDKNVVVAVIDTGIQYNHEDLHDNIWVNEDEVAGNGIDDDGNGFIDDIWGWDCWDDDNEPWDYGSHGTGCAGIIGAVQDNHVGLSGIAPGVTIMPIKVKFAADYSSDMTIMYAFDYVAANDVDICSMSFGGDDVDPLFEESINDLWDNGNGPLLLASAGNANSTGIFYPAWYDCTMSIAATIPWNKDNTPADERRINPSWGGWWWGSNYGPKINVSGFGERYMTTMSGSTSAYRDGINAGFFNGTSCASPTVAGTAALMMTFHPGETNFWYWARLENTADDLDVPGRDDQTGHGRINTYRAVYGSDRYSDIEDQFGFVPMAGANPSMYDTIHDVPGNPHDDKFDRYRITAASTGCMTIGLDIFTWGENVDMALYDNMHMTNMIEDSTGENHAGSSHEYMTVPVIAGWNYFLSVYSPEIGNSTTYGLTVSYTENHVSTGGASIAPSNASAGDSDVPLLVLEFETECAASLDKLIVSKHTSVTGQDWGLLSLYVDSNNNGTFDGGDQLIATESGGAVNRAKFENLDISWTDNRPLRIFVTADILPDVGVGSEVYVSIENYKDVVVDGILSEIDEGYAGYPIKSGVVGIG